MKLRQSADGGLQVVLDDRRLAGWLLGACLACVWLALYRLFQDPTPREQLIGALGGAGVFLVAGLAVFEHSVVDFDPGTRTVDWRRGTLFSAARGRLAFDSVRSVSAESSVSNRDELTWRMVLHAEDGPIPLSRAYRGDPDGRCVRIAARLNALLGRSGPDEIVDAVLGLVKAGHELDALRLLGAEHGLSLAEARQALTRLREDHGDS